MAIAPDAHVRVAENSSWPCPGPLLAAWAVDPDFPSDGASGLLRVDVAAAPPPCRDVQAPGVPSFARQQVVGERRAGQRRSATPAQPGGWHQLVSISIPPPGGTGGLRRADTRAR